MNVFKMLNGKTVTVDQFMQGPTISKNHHWESTGYKEWTERGFIIETVDPNKRELFGYEESEFLAKQYR